MGTFKKIALTFFSFLVVLLLAGYLYLSVYLPNPDPAPEITVEITEERVA